MQKIVTFVSFIIVCILFVPAAFGQNAKSSQGQLDTLKKKASYAIGVQIASNLKANDPDLDLPILLQGITDAYDQKKLQLSNQQIVAALTEFNRVMQAKAIEKNKKLSEKNLSEGKAFLAANAKKPGVKVLPSGLQYKIIKAGSGKTPKQTDNVKAHYHGTLIDGAVFDSSIQRGEPITIPVGGVIKGWQEALQMMRVGGKWKLYIPADLAYGANPRSGSPIGPNAVLIFDIELLGIQ